MINNKIHDLKYTAPNAGIMQSDMSTRKKRTTERQGESWRKRETGGEVEDEREKGREGGSDGEGSRGAV